LYIKNSYILLLPELKLFDDRIVFKQLKIVLLPFYHYSHGPTTWPNGV